MAILDFLKNKKSAEKSRKTVKKTEKVLVARPNGGQAKKEEKKTEASKPVSTSVKTGKFSYEVVRQPHISEKASYLAEKNQYVFEVSPNYNKNEIKDAVAGIYGVDVLSVNVIKIPAKKRRLGKTEGFRKAYKKAVVTIKEGQKIEIL
ncbi:MAG: 50S ribosomal protein L23 [Candidatus Staskawiczbacteria bacterium]|nr:50S ribosomal protein L23 [Candidatus Staskawiczbacteria bacterium]